MGKIQKISALYPFVLSSLSVTKQISHHCTVFVIIRVEIPPKDFGFLSTLLSGIQQLKIIYIDFKRNKVFIRSVLTHAEYDK
ncbi:MAG: type II toxin-antitoxin system HigB family toxin [Xenococcaceae cyanobacterium]